ncbi:MAG TPA: VWA domain-containing protein [Pyrinomonadaceae bacterium]|nr:VWA domain-containing protein [Pyrinomonadaceae bacterium]
MSSRPHSFVFLLLLLGAALCFLSLPATATQQDAIRIDVPEGVRVRIENQFGEVAAEAWKEKYVSVSASIESNEASFKRSPVVIERKSKLLLISVIRRPIDPQVQINLTIKLPEGAQAEIVTKDGSTTMTAAVVASSEPNTTTSTDETSKPPKLIAEGATDKRAGTPAPNAGAEEVSEGDVIRVDSQLAVLNLSVIDRNTNRGIVDLSQSDFRLFEDGIEQQILKFESSSAPFDLILLIDISGSTREVVKLIQAAALRFVEAARSADRIGIISFAGKPTLVSSVTWDRQVLRERVNAIATADGDTKAYDALAFAVSEVMKSQNTRNMRRTAIVMMSDGLDGSIPGVLGDGSKISYAELMRRIQEFDGVLYTLWLNTEYEAMNPLDTQPEAFDMGHDRMKDLAEAGGGVFYRVERLEDLAGAYERVVADLGTVYSLTYRPANNVRDGKWRAVKVNVSIPSAVARGKHGYYAN